MTRDPGLIPGDQPFDLTSVCFCKLTVGIFVFYDHFYKNCITAKIQDSCFLEVAGFFYIHTPKNIKKGEYTMYTHEQKGQTSTVALVSTDEAKQGFYPTPPDLADKLLAGVDWSVVRTVLEPSAGTGNLIDAVCEKFLPQYYRSGWGGSHGLAIDAIEIDPNLRAILSYSWGGGYANEIRHRLETECKSTWDSINRCYTKLTEEQEALKQTLETEKEKRNAAVFHLIHDDFLTFQGRTKYDLIVMNPPFANGSEHLLKAISLVRPYGGQIRCILNAETVRNLCTHRRKLLSKLLQDYGATITYEENCFTDAERTTNVEVALISFTVPAPEAESEIWSRLKAAQRRKEPEETETCQDIAPTELIARIIGQYNMEVDAGLALLKEYEALKPFIMDELEKTDDEGNPSRSLCSKPILKVTVNDQNCDMVNRYIQAVRKKYWQGLFNDDRIIGAMTSNLQHEYQGMVNRLVDYEFSEFNIRTILAEMNAKMSKSVENAILELFDKMTAKHSYYPEFSQNIHLYNGWKTNQAHKIDKKVILPCNGYCASWRKDELNEYHIVSVIMDIEKCLNYLAADHHNTNYWDTTSALRGAARRGDGKNILCKFFSATFYKKGTVHLKFHKECQDLIDRFNIFAGQRKGWLPPSYGKVRYSDMQEEEQAVVDSFHGDETPGSGEAAYAQVLTNSRYYLTSPASANALPMLPEQCAN